MTLLNSYYFDVSNCFSPISISNKPIIKPNLCLMTLKNRSQYYTCYRQKHVAEYYKSARNYWENSSDEINGHQKTLAEETWNYSDFIMKMNI